MRWSWFLLLAGVGYSQTPARLEFEVATIKPFTRNDKGGFPLRTSGGPGTSDPGRIAYTNLTLKSLLMSAYGVGAYQISAPDWTDSDAGRFVIEATIQPGATKEQVNQMLQNLLLERFKMTLHREAKDLPVYELTLVKRGPKLRESLQEGAALPTGRGAFPGLLAEKDDFQRLQPRPLPFLGPGVEWATLGHQHAVGGNQTIAGLAAYLSFRLKRPVVDKTGLTGNWDYNLDFAPNAGTANPNDSPSDPAPDLIGAVRDQLGLKLNAAKGPIEMLVVDHIEKTPTEN